MGKREEYNIDKRLKKNDILTIPNALTCFRLVLIPLFLWLYCSEEEYVLGIVVVAISGISDILDGYLARRFDMISDVGKVLDPIADKLTQAALIFSLCIRYPMILYLFGLFALREIAMVVWGAQVLKHTDTVNGSRWYGKMATVVLEVSMGFLLLFRNVSEETAGIIFLVCAVCMVFSLVMYSIFYYGKIRECKVKSLKSGDY